VVTGNSLVNGWGKNVRHQGAWNKPGINLRAFKNEEELNRLELSYSRGSIGGHSFIRDGGLDPGLVFQFCAFTFAGICLVVACLKEIYKGINHDSVFILLWFFGIFMFACYLNWTINARSFILL
jgi:hypothetical protein